jgi:hypothetical protein
MSWGRGLNRTRKLYRSEPNTLCFKAYGSLVLRGFKLFFDHPFNARSLPHHRPFIVRQLEDLGEIFLCSVRNCHFSHLDMQK